VALYKSISNHPAIPITAPSTTPSDPRTLADPAPALLDEMPKPLAIYSPGSREVVNLLPSVLMLFDGDAVVLAVLLAGVRGIVLVLPSTTRAVPLGSSEYVVPETTTDAPALSVVPCPSTNSVVPSRTVAEYVLPSMVRAAAAVMGPWPSVEVSPLMTTTEPDADAGREYVVPEIVRAPPGVNV
jgi:hypothetical protein